jgi:DNA-binding CsgD family transcriptional regulator
MSLLRALADRTETTIAGGYVLDEEASQDGTGELDTVLRLIGLIYDCAVRPQLWPKVLRDVMRFTQGIAVSDDRAPEVGFLTAYQEGKLTHSQKRRLQIFVPHLYRATLFNARLRRAEQLQRASEIALEATPSAALLVDENGLITFANCAATRLTSAVLGETSSGDARPFWRLAQEKADQAKLQAAFQKVLDKRSGSRTAHCTFTKGSRTSPRTYAVEISNLTIESSVTVPRLLVTITNAERQSTIDGSLLLSHFRLTPAEKRITFLLGSGHCVRSAARIARVAPSTVRSQLKSIFRKIGVRRQAELVRLFLQLSRVSVGGRTLY